MNLCHKQYAKMKSLKILWVISIQTDHVIEARRPDTIIVRRKATSAKKLISLPRTVERGGEAGSEVRGPQKFISLRK